MQYVLVTVKDNAVQAYQQIQCSRAIGEAVRAFTDAINDPQNKQLHAHPEDFDLYTVGTFDDLSGIIVQQEPELILRGVQAKR